jgi:CDGSH-type Zn-finger protein
MPESNTHARPVTKYRVKVLKDGPYLVTGGVPLSDQAICRDPDGISHGWQEGKKYPARDTYALCRCGHTKNKPFCDGTHKAIQFDGTETAAHTPYRDQSCEVDGPGLKLTDAGALCAHAGFCDRATGAWKLTEDSADPVARQTAIEEACDCPSGRLVACDKDGHAIEPAFEPSIGLVVDDQAGNTGPIWVRGGIPIESADGSTYEVRNRVTLCNCGRSANKPFCDGTHARK